MSRHDAVSPTYPAAERDLRGKDLQEENERLTKIVRVLMDRSERVTGQAVSEYGEFQRKIVLGSVVRQKTEYLQRALDRNEAMTRRLRLSEARFRGLAEQSLVGIAIVEGSSFTFANTRFAHTLGYTRDEIMGVPIGQTVADDSLEKFTGHLEKCAASASHDTLLAYQGLRKDGTILDLELSSSPLRVDEEEAIVLVLNDVTERNRAERKIQLLTQQLAEQAMRDPLTGLYNRRFLESSLDRELARATRESAPLSLVVCDLDHFKQVNDSYGHQIGDEVLKDFAARLNRLCRKSDVACRFGGEEFVIAFPGMPVYHAVKWAERMRSETAQAEIPVGADTLRITASFGVAAFPLHGRNWQDIIAAADAAQYAAKASGRNKVRLAPSGSPGMEMVSAGTWERIVRIANTNVTLKPVRGV